MKKSIHVFNSLSALVHPGHTPPPPRARFFHRSFHGRVCSPSLATYHPPSGCPKLAFRCRGTTRIKSAHTQGLLIKSSLKRLPEYLDAQLHVPTKPGRAQPLPQAGKQWKKYKGLVKIFVKCIVALLSAPADPETDIFFLQCAVPLCRYVATPPFCAGVVSLYGATTLANRHRSS